MFKTYLKKKVLLLQIKYRPQMDQIYINFSWNLKTNFNNFIVIILYRSYVYFNWLLFIFLLVIMFLF